MNNIGNLNCENQNCFILDDFSSQDILPFEPAEYWYLDLYIITLADVDGVFSSSNQKYMVLEYPSYTEVNSHNKINDCIWSVPYMAYAFKKPGVRRFTTIGAIRKFYIDQIEQHKSLLEELENYRFYHMGISDYEKHEGSHYIEYKVSSRQPDKWKCYYIQEHYITGIDSLGLLNLTDPEGLHSYRYFPLISPPKADQNVVYFLGKHLSSNVTYLLKNSYNKLLYYSNAVLGNTLKYNLYGLLFKIDVIGFTKLYNRVVNEMKSLDETGKEIAEHFIAGLSKIYEYRMQEYGVLQFVVEGDGITGSLPISSTEMAKGVASIINCVEQIRHDINTLVLQLEEKICLRCSIIAGQYNFGKLAGLSSSKQATGEIMISLSRIDQFLQNHIKDNPDLQDKGICLCVGNHPFTVCKELFQDYGFTSLFLQSNFRETRINATVLYKED